MRTITLGTRKSNLALKQTEWVQQELEKLDLPYHFEVKKISTKGDRVLDRTLSKVGGKGLFVKEIEQALTDGEIDIAVHSMKDLPGEMAEGFEVGAVTNRVDPRDAYIANDHVKFHNLPLGAVIGTSSLRRTSQIKAERPDLNVQWIRGNIETRLRKLREESFDAIILAAAGLERMGWSDEIVTEFLDPAMCVPAVGQGALGIECRSGDEDILKIIQHLHDEPVAVCVAAERAFLKAVEGGCAVPIGGYATLNKQGNVQLTTMIGSTDGKKILKEKLTGDNPEDMGRKAAHALLGRGGKEILDQAREEMGEE